MSERHSRAPRWSAGPRTCFTQLKLTLHWMAVGGAPDNAIPRLLACVDPAMPESLCDYCADVSALLSWSLKKNFFMAFGNPAFG